MNPFTNREDPRAYRTRFVWAGGFSVVCWMAVQLLAPGGTVVWTPAMSTAAEGMEAALGRFSEACLHGSGSRDVPDSGSDPGFRSDPSIRDGSLTAEGTCLIGPEHGGLFTSLGQVGAKRTALSPDVSAVLVHLLTKAGVGPGDRVAVGASGSFPGLLVATLEAVAAMDAEPVTILSLGASSFGATDPAHNLLHVYDVLRANPGLDRPPAAVSLGGAGDVGGEFEAPLRDSLVGMVEAAGQTVLLEPDLTRNVSARMSLYRSGGRNPAVFVNIGGAEANMGTSPAILSVRPGLTFPGDDLKLPPPTQRGVLFQMLGEDVPVIHLLHVQGLALRFGLVWDPVILPPAGSTRLSAREEPEGIAFWFLTILFASGLLFIVTRGRRSSGK